MTWCILQPVCGVADAGLAVPRQLLDGRQHCSVSVWCFQLGYDHSGSVCRSKPDLESHSVVLWKTIHLVHAAQLVRCSRFVLVPILNVACSGGNRGM